MEILKMHSSHEEALSHRKNASQLEDVWKQTDDTILTVARNRRSALIDIQSAGLTKPISIGDIIYQTERASARTGANISMDGHTAGELDNQDFDLIQVPVPVIHSDFSFNDRQLSSSSKKVRLDDSMNVEAVEVVMDKEEDSIFNGVPSIVVGGANFYGYTTHPNRQTVTLTATWTNSGTRDIIQDVLNLLAAASSVKKHGPYTLYVPSAYWTAIQDDYSTTKGDRTYLERILAFKDITKVSTSDALGADEVVLVEMKSTTLNYVNAQAITTVQWSVPPMKMNYRVFSIGALILKPDYEDQLGVVHGSL